MIGIPTLRLLVSKGWTIANRRNIISQIGKSRFTELSSLANKANLLDCFDYSSVSHNLTSASFDMTKKKLEGIITSYKKYAESPYINANLREGSALSDESAELVNNLKNAINSNNISGIFIRGLSPTRKNRLETVEDVSKFILRAGHIPPPLHSLNN